MRFGLPQIIMLGTYFMNVGIYAARHGQSKENETYNIWNAIVGSALGIGILYWGGFFS